MSEKKASTLDQRYIGSAVLNLRKLYKDHPEEEKFIKNLIKIIAYFASASVRNGARDLAETMNKKVFEE